MNHKTRLELIAARLREQRESLLAEIVDELVAELTEEQESVAGEVKHNHKEGEDEE